MKIFIPSYNSNNCAVIYNNNTLRVYDNRPTQNSNVNYTDYYYNSHYYNVRGTQNFSQYSNLPTCLNSSNISTEVYYRNDFAEILIIFFILSIFIVWLPIKIYSNLFKRLK